jgi:hypothetical protein
MKRISKLAQDMASTTTMQNIQTLKNELNRLSPMLRDLPNQLNMVNELIRNIETQVTSLEQMKSKIQQQTAQSADDANDRSNFENLVREITGKSWAAISRLFGKNDYKDVPDSNSVAGIRGSIEYNSTKIAKDKSKSNKGDKGGDECEDTAPSFWRSNLDYWSHNE